MNANNQIQAAIISPLPLREAAEKAVSALGCLLEHGKNAPWQAWEKALNANTHLRQSLASLDADRNDAPDDVEVTYLVWAFQGQGSWTDATKEIYDAAKTDDRMAVVSLDAYLSKEKRTHPQQQAAYAGDAEYAFARWLSSRDGVLPVGACCDAAPVAEAVEAYLNDLPHSFAPQQPQAAQAAGPQGWKLAKVPVDTPDDDWGEPIVYDTNEIDQITHALTGDEGEDDSVTVLHRFVAHMKAVYPGKNMTQVLIETEEQRLSAAPGAAPVEQKGKA